MLLGAVVVIDGVEHAFARSCRRAQQHGRLAAIGTDLDADTMVEITHRHVVERASLVSRHEAGHSVGQGE